jgi:hypothetical protein
MRDMERRDAVEDFTSLSALCSFDYAAYTDGMADTRVQRYTPGAWCG